MGRCLRVLEVAGVGGFVVGGEAVVSCWGLGLSARVCVGAWLGLPAQEEWCGWAPRARLCVCEVAGRVVLSWFLPWRFTVTVWVGWAGSARARGGLVVLPVQGT